MKALIGFVAVLALVTVACGQTDPGVTTSIQAKLAQDDVVQGRDIDVSTEDGVVTLTGEVETVEERERVLLLTRETEGVREVRDELRVVATTGERDEDFDLDIDVDADLERGARKAGKAAREGAEEVGEAAEEFGEAVRDTVTDEDRDSDNDGK